MFYCVYRLPTIELDLFNLYRCGFELHRISSIYWKKDKRCAPI